MTDEPQHPHEPTPDDDLSLLEPWMVTLAQRRAAIAAVLVGGIAIGRYAMPKVAAPVANTMRETNLLPRCACRTDSATGNATRVSGRRLVLLSQAAA